MTTVSITSGWLRNYIREKGGRLCLARRVVIAG